MRREILNVTVPPPLIQAAKKDAKKRHISTSLLVSAILAKHYGADPSILTLEGPGPRGPWKYKVTQKE